ncbi:GNAT family N-acetyltransferase [Marinomonas agarivorans]|nr:GNAT family N-acetyltransferase [Marinomonas agarivorans]
MSIRRATKEDAEKLSDLVKSLAHFYLDHSTDELPQWLTDTLTSDAFVKRLASKEYINFIYEQDSDIAGYISLKKPNHIYHLFVSEQYQGNGISRLLWNHAKSSVAATSFTLRSSVYAIPIYKRFGFVESDAIGTKDGISFQPMKLVQH